METNQENCCGNVYVNYCCPNSGSGSSSSFKGTNVYVDWRNTNATPDGTINNPFRTLVEAFDYVDSSDESYVINIFNAEDYSVVDYSFKSKGNLGITGTVCPMEQDFLPLILRFSDEEAKVSLEGLRVDLVIYGAYSVFLNDLFVTKIDLYDTGSLIYMNNCRSHVQAFPFQIGYENGNTGTLNNMLINNCSLEFIVDRHVYFAWITNSNISSIWTGVSDASIQIAGQGCSVENIYNNGSLSTSYFSFQNSRVNGIANYNVDESNPLIYIAENDMYLNNNFEPVNYSPSKHTLMASLEAIDAKLGELQARLDA